MPKEVRMLSSTLWDPAISVLRTKILTVDHMVGSVLEEKGLNTHWRILATDWDAIYRPPITKRLNSLISGDLVLVDADIGIFPYLCGFESQITGVLSPFCSTFTDTELKNYEYRQDLRYYYGTGPGTDLPSKMMLPFLNGVVDLISKGPNQYVNERPVLQLFSPETCLMITYSWDSLKIVMSSAPSPKIFQVGIF